MSVDGSAGLPVPKGTHDVPVPALMVRLGVGKEEHDYDKSGCDVLPHGRYSVVVSTDL